MNFKSRKDPLTLCIVFACCSVMLLFLFVTYRQEGASALQIILSIVPTLIVIGIILWMVLDVGYTIQDGYIKYRAGWIRGKIKIANIKRIRVNETMWVGFRPASARNGLIIENKKQGEIYISPDSNDSFVDALLLINPAIQIHRKSALETS